MAQYERSVIFSVPAEQCYEALLAALAALHIGLRGRDPASRTVRAFWWVRGTQFVIRAECAPLGPAAADLRLAYDPVWTPLLVRPMGGAVPASLDQRMDRVLAALAERLRQQVPAAEEMSRGQQGASKQLVLVHEVLPVRARTRAPGNWAASFNAWRPLGPFRREEWVVRLQPEAIEFLPASGGVPIVVPREQARQCIEFPTSLLFWGATDTINLSGEGWSYALRLEPGGAARLRGWLPGKTEAQLARALRDHGLGLIGLALVQWALSHWLDPVSTGAMAVVALIAVVGLLNLLVPDRAMLFVNGIALVLLGILNIAGTCARLLQIGNAAILWTALGILQIAWAAHELGECNEFSTVSDTSRRSG